MDCHPNTHPQTTGQCSTTTKTGRGCKSNAVAWQLDPTLLDNGQMGWTERCKRHMRSERDVLRTYTFEQCWDAVRPQVMAKIDAMREPVTEAAPELDTPQPVAGQRPQAVSIEEWLDSRAGLNGTLMGEWGHTCDHCDSTIPARSTGRPPRFCSTRCRVAAHRAAKKEATA